MSSFSFKFKKAIFNAMDQSIEDSNLEIAAKVTAQVKALSPAKEGQLRNSWMYRAPKEEGGFNDSGDKPAPTPITSKPKKGEAYVGSNLDYATYQEFGTKKMKAQPSLQPAIDLIVNGKEPEEVIEEYSRKVVKDTSTFPFNLGV